MAPSADTCVLCSAVFYGKQKYLRCVSCKQRAHNKCVVLPDEELQLLRSGAQPFLCNLCATVDADGRPSDAPDDSMVSPRIPASAPLAAPAVSPLVVPGDGETGLRELLLNALQGISFLTDSVAELRECNDRLRRENARELSQQTDTIASLRSEVRRLRDELSLCALSVRPRGTTPPKPNLAAAACVQSVGASKATVSVSATPLRPPTHLPPRVPAAMTTATPPLSALLPTASVNVTSPSSGLRATKSNDPALLGSSDSTGLVVVNPPKRPKLVFVSKLSPSTTAEQLQAHLSSVNVAPLFCHRLKTKYETYASFCVGVDDMYFQRLCDPCTWPSDCLFKPFRGRLHSDMILSPNTNSVPLDDKKQR